MRGDLYFHVSAAKEVSTSARILMDEGSTIARLRPAEDFNVIKIGKGGTKVSLLFYTDFLNDPFPQLGRVCTIDLENRTFRHRSYRQVGNPPILHKKELLLSLNHPSRRLFEELTSSLVSIGIRPAKPGLGFKRQWEEYLDAMNVVIDNHKLKGLGNDHD